MLLSGVVEREGNNFFELHYLLDFILGTGNVLSHVLKIQVIHRLLFLLHNMCMQHKSKKTCLVEMMLDHFVAIKMGSYSHYIF